MAIFEHLPSAPDGRPYWLDKRFASLFTWGRPPLPGATADLLAAVADRYEIRSALVLGSCCPSVLTAIGFGDPKRQIRMIDMKSRWWEGYGGFLEDSDEPDRYPKYDAWLPAKRIGAMSEWSWSPRLGEMIFVDVPGLSELVDADLVRVVHAVAPRLVVIGFMEGHPGPAELEAALRDQSWLLEEATFSLANHETGEVLSYRMVVGVRPSEGANQPESDKPT